MNQYFSKKQLIAIAVVVLVCITFAIVLLNTPIYIKNLGTSLEQNGLIVNTITVTGDGKVTVKPDMAVITFSVSELANTSEEALDNANVKVNQVAEILKNNGVAENDIQTSQFSIFPEYDYSRSGDPVVKGQRAGISVTVKIKGLDSKSSKATKIIDEISTIDKIQLGSISFDLENKETACNTAREAAFKKAKQKADDLATLSGVKLLKPVSIIDASVNVSNPIPSSTLATASLDTVKSTNLSSGELELSINLNVIFGIE